MSISCVPVAVIGGGIAGLAAASRVAGQLGSGSVLVLERAPAVGGKLVTVRRDGFVLEAGPDSFLAAKTAGLQLLRQVGLAARCIVPDETMRGAFVRRNWHLHPLPAGMTGLVPGRVTPLLQTRLLSMPGRVRAAMEWFVPPRRGTDDESLAAFTRRRFGDEAWDWLVEPLLSGIYAGDGRTLSLRATFPQLADGERSHGGVLRAMLAARRAPSVAAGGAPTGFVSLAGGMGELVEGVRDHLGAEVLRTHADVASVQQDGESFVIECRDGRAWRAQAAIVATPAGDAASLLDDVDAPLSTLLREIPFVSVATVSVAFADADIPRPLRGTGWIAPRADGGPVVACTWASNKFAGRAPAGHVLLRLFIGRAGNDDIAHADDDTIQAVVRDCLARTHGILAEPLLWHIHRWPQGMPQYTMGHTRRMEAITRRLDSIPGLFLAGSSYRGVGIPDCIRSGWSAAEQALSTLAVNA